MRYDRDFERYRFSTDRVIDADTVSALYQEYDQYRMSLLTTDLKNSVYRMNGVEPERHKNPGSILLGCFFGVSMIAMVIAFISKRFYVGGALAALVFGSVGLLSICGQTMISADRDTHKERVKMVIRGILLLIGAIYLGLLMFLKDRFDSESMLIYLSVGAFGLASVWLFVMALFEFFYAGIFYNEKVRARCVGYVRMVDSDSSGEGSLPFKYIRMSPVFEYDYNGERYEALYDELITRNDSDIEVGQYEMLRISSRYPDNVYSGWSTRVNAISLLVFGIFAGIATAVIVWFGFLN
ncbi:MAG: hypothetical protein K6C99_06145 [Lachnospiraceae bacterium]|nr:hypothetical protein [Lachnospiraceae bacterium]